MKFVISGVLSVAFGVALGGTEIDGSWTETSPLDPTQVEFWFDGAGHMAADVVAPIRVAHVGSGGREVRLEGKRIPHRYGVSGKSDLIAVISEAAPAVKEQRAFALTLLVGEEDVVNPPGGV